MKRCAGCGNDFPIERYKVKLRWNDGKVRGRQSRCPICLAEQRLDQQRARRLRLASDTPVDAEIVVRLPIGPWRDWIEAELERLRCDPDVDAQALLSVRMGVDDRRLYSWRRSTQRISLDTIDRACCALGDPGLLRELYPALYSFDEEKVAA